MEEKAMGRPTLEGTVGTGESRSLPVRFPGQQLRDIKSVADRFGLPRAEVVRRAVEFGLNSLRRELAHQPVVAGDGAAPRFALQYDAETGGVRHCRCGALVGTVSPEGRGFKAHRKTGEFLGASGTHRGAQSLVITDHIRRCPARNP